MSHLIRSCAVLVFLAVVVAGGYAWQQAENAAAERAEWVSAPIEGEDDTVGISLSASGLLNQDVVVSAYVLGEEDRSTEDFWLEDLARGLHEVLECVHSNLSDSLPVLSNSAKSAASIGFLK